MVKYLNLSGRFRLPAAGPKTTVFLFLMVTAMILTTTIYAQQTTASAAAEQRARGWVTAMNSNDRAAWRKFITENYAKSVLERAPIEARLGNYARIYDETRGMTVQGVRVTKPNEVTLSAKSVLTGMEANIILTVEEQAPFNIVSIGFRPAPPATDKKMSDKEIVAELENHLKKIAAADVFSGTVLIARGQNVLYEKAFGEANKDFKVPNNLETKFNLGSMNKMFTAVAIAQLVEAGKLSFDDSLGKFLPDFPDKEAAEKIKIKHLLSHTSGLGNYFNRAFFDGSRARFRTIDDFLALAKDEKMQFEPGSRWQYSNTGMLVLGKIIEKASGRDYFDYIRENIYKKAGMTDSDSFDLDNVNPNLAVGYEKDFTEQGTVFRNNIFLHVIKGGPAGGGYSTVRDLLKFANALRDGRLVGKDYVKTLTTPKPELNSPGYGYGFIIGENPDTFGHSGGFPGISSELIMFANSDFTAIVLSNYGTGSSTVTGKIRGLAAACATCATAQK
ncbi:MAG TPA: serine hydrolase domain-containing protein [Pyrinomonadaceae bacterium]|jgi:CubicO group peptidase (beta-lactamase class C family)